MSHLRVKICGITSAEDARAAAAAGADAIGLNFHPQSPRVLQGPQAYTIIKSLPPFVEPVGVFTNAKTLGELPGPLGLKYVQWHGELSDLPAVTPGFAMMYRLIVAFRVRDQQSLNAASHWLKAHAQSPPAAILIDGYQRDILGGTGTAAPWELLAQFKPGVPLILAGGLTPENVAEAVRIVRPYAVDVASGVESSPGKKDVDKIKRFIDNARSAFA